MIRYYMPYENEENRMEALLWAIEDISDVFGLKLNKNQCIQMSVGKTRELKI